MNPPRSESKAPGSCDGNSWSSPTQAGSDSGSLVGRRNAASGFQPVAWSSSHATGSARPVPQTPTPTPSGLTGCAPACDDEIAAAALAFVIVVVLPILPAWSTGLVGFALSIGGCLVQSALSSSSAL